MHSPLQTVVAQAFAAIEAKDVDALMGLFADDAVLIDPHFPTPQMCGKAFIADAFREAVAGMDSFGYTITHYFEAVDGHGAAVETATHHVLRGGKQLDFPQVFIFESADGLITRMQAYEPYGPHGIMGAFLSLSRLARRFSRK